MRQHLLRILGVGTVLAVAFSARPRMAEAQVFPGAGGATATWLPITRNGANVTDGVNTTPDDRDIVGDAANPAAYVASDASFLFFRVRVNANPGAGGGGYQANGWGCIVETNATLTNYEFLAILDGNGGGSDNVRYYWNSNQAVNTTLDDANTEVTSFNSDTHARSSVAAGTNFSANADYFVDIAIPWATIRTPGAGAPTVPAGTPLRFICGTSENNPTNNVTKDVASADAENSPATLTNSWSDAYVCNFGGNTSCTSYIDTDADGVADSVEVALGTDPTKKDTDGDGIPDNVELTPQGGGVFAAINSDPDAIIDALDPDSDNDCVTDATEGAATYRNAALPNANPSAACVAPATRFCNPLTGVCVGCNGSNGSGAAQACPTTTAPGCNTGGALIGQCTQCTASVLTQCVGTTPTCQTSTGTCASCNGNNGTIASQACTTALAPACNTAGGTLNGRCTECKPGFLDLCTVDKPACSTASGNCNTCNGHFGTSPNSTCPTLANRACHFSGPLLGRCTQCAATNTAACSGTTPFCDLATGLCAPCGGDFGSGATNACATAGAPACNTTGTLVGTCTQCKPGPTTAACPIATPTCSTVTGACTTCNGANGSGATQECPDPTVPACNPVGAPLAGRCTTCSSNRTSLCTDLTPSCDLPSGSCAPCNGDRGTGTTHACPTEANPYCNLTDGPNGVAGTCGKCSGAGQCSGPAHAGPVCDVPTGTCIDTDSDGDGLNDSIELLFGTDPAKKDTDGDGIEDKVEVTPNGGGAPTKVDSDGDGIIDALDTDSDNDGLLDKDEGALDTDGDGAADYRDTDDDGDGIFTKDELLDAKAAKLSDDVDNDGKKNWLDDEADGDGIKDGVEGRGDNDGDGIPNYLDAVNDPPKVPDAGTPPVSTSSSSSSSSSSSGNIDPDAGTSGNIAPPGEGVLEGSGLFCSSSPREKGSSTVVLALSALALALGSRRRRNR